MHRPLVGIAISYLTGILLSFSLNASLHYLYPLLVLSCLLALFFLSKKSSHSYYLSHLLLSPSSGNGGLFPES